MNHEFESILAKEHFEKNKHDMLDIVIRDMLNNDPLTAYNIEQELIERGIPGYEQKQIHERLEMYAELMECFKVRTGYIGSSQELFDQLQFNCLFIQCRKPHERVMRDSHTNHSHTYIEDGFDTDESQRIPVPNGSRVFARIHYLPHSKYVTQFFSHIYAYKHKDGPMIPVDMWFYGCHSN